MPKIDYTQIFQGLKDVVVSTVLDDAKDFVEANSDAGAFLKEQAADLAQLAVNYAKATGDDERKSILFSMKLVEQSVKNKLAGIAVDAEAQARAAFARTVENVLRTVIKAIPILLSAAI